MDNKKKDYRKERQRLSNDMNQSVSKQGVSVEEYRESLEQKNKKQKLDGPPSFFRRRKNILFNANYIVVLMMTLLLIGNTIGRGFAGTFWYILPNVLFLIMYLIVASYINPIDFSSDNKNYIYPSFNKLYMNLSKISEELLTRIGKNLNKKPKGSLITSFIIVIIGYVCSLLFYNSNFELLAIPIFVIYLVRVIASRSFKEQLGSLNTMKWILFILLIINAILSVFWKTPFDYSLFVIISMYNSSAVWFKNMHIYSNSDINY